MRLRHSLSFEATSDTPDELELRISNVVHAVRPGQDFVVVSRALVVMLKSLPETATLGKIKMLVGTRLEQWSVVEDILSD